MRSAQKRALRQIVRLVAVVLRLERAFGLNTDIAGLIFAQLGQVDADPRQVQAGDFFVQVLWQDVDVVLVGVAVGPQLDLSQHLVGEGRRHDERWMACGVAEVQQTALGQKDHAIARRHLDHVDLFLDVRPLVVLQRRDLDFVVEVTNVADDGHVLHLAHVLDADHVLVAGRGDDDVGCWARLFQRDDLKTVHGGLQGADRVDLGDLYPGAGAAERGGRAFADIAVAADDGGFTSHHRVSCAADAVDERFFTAVLVVELRLGD